MHHVTWSVNSVCHFFGRRRFDIDDHSTNVGWLAVLSLGESWHHNHHAFPRSAYHGLRWWEIDPSGLIIAGMQRVGLAWNVVRISPERQRARVLADACVLSALGADAGDHDLNRLRVEPGVAGRRAQRLGVELAVEVVDSPAVAADGVLVGLGPGVVEGGAGAGIDPADQSQPDEQVKRRVDGRRRGTGELVADREADLVGGGVVGPAAELAQDDQPLGRRPLPAGVQQLDEVGWDLRRRRGRVGSAGRLIVGTPRF